MADEGFTTIRVKEDDKGKFDRLKQAEYEPDHVTFTRLVAEAKK